VEGLWVGLWHPNLTEALGFPGAPAAFRGLVERLATAAPYVAPLGDLVSWRRFRRSARVIHLRPDGGVHLVTWRTGRWSLQVEDPEGRPVDATVAVRDA
jgi:hypothetical protein